LYLASIATCLLAVYLVTYRPFTAPAAQPANRPAGRPAQRTTLFALGLILLLAAFLRLYHLDIIPYGLWYDEADNGLQVRRMIQDPSWRPVYVPATNLPSHFLYLVLFSFKLLGETPLALRAVAVVLGLLTVPAAYLAGRELFPGDQRLALVLAFFLAVSRWDVNWSRIGMHGVSVPLFELLTTGLLLRALRTGRLTTFAWAGVALGLGLCFYTPFRLFPVVMALFLGAWWLGRRLATARDRSAAGQMLARGRAVVVPVLVFAMTTLLTVAPVVQFALQQPDIFWERAHKISILRDPTATDLPLAIAQNTAKHALMFNYRGDRNGRHNLPGAPMLDDAVGALFVLGLSASLARLKRPRYLLLVLRLCVMLAGGILSVTFEAPQSLRAIGTLPAAYALATAALELLLAEAEGVFRRPWPRRVIQGALALSLALVGWANFYTYFYQQARDFAVWNAFATAETQLVHEIRQLRDSYDLYFDPLLFRHLTTQFLLPDFSGYVAYDPATIFPVPDPSPGKQGVVLFIAPDSRPTRTLFESYYPAVRREEFGHPYGGPTVLFTYILDKQVIAATHGLVGRYYLAGDALPRFQRLDLAVDFDWVSEEPPVPLPLRADWQGSLKVPVHGLYQFAVEAPGAVEMWLDQAPLPLDADGASASISLPGGVHALRLVCHVEGPVLSPIEGGGTVRLLWRTPQEPAWTPVPEAVLYHDPFTGHGLVGRFYSNDSWSDMPAFSRIDPMIAYYFHHIPMQRPYTVEWRGRLEIPEGGRWALGAEALSASWLYLDGQEVLANTQFNQYRQIELDLLAGWYDLTLRFLDAGDHSHIYLYWQPPGELRELIPTDYFLPPVEVAWTITPAPVE
ncbi:MAG: glycosyltransferase family 39 protein, partial [Anaerolineae bacterium]